MANPLNLFPARVPTGRVTIDGRTFDVLMTTEFSRALSDLLLRVGGVNGLGSDDLAALASSTDSSGQLLALHQEVEAMRTLAEQAAAVRTLRAEIAELRALVEQAGPALALHRQIEAMRVELAMIEDPGAQVRYILTRYAPLLSPTFTGTPNAPTAAVDTNTDQLATTKFVLNQAAAANPVVNGVATPGTSTRYARADHVHPTDTSRQAAIAAATVTGSRGSNPALTSLLSGLAGQGLIVDSTTA